MGLRGKLKIRQYVDFEVDGKMFRVHEITFRTRGLAEIRAEEIDKAVG